MRMSGHLRALFAAVLASREKFAFLFESACSADA